jgi:2-keto-4-pentenoate hydratase/2-oxohepta-3-ene-1,7-dioic acid hydratase in catechol pathway
MRLASFRIGDRDTWGMVEGDQVLDLGNVYAERFTGLRSVIAAGAYAELRAAAAARAARVPLASVTLLPVIPDPGKILCIGLNYDTHRLETGREKSGYPAVFTRFADSQLGAGRPIVRPKVSTQLDYEGELAVIIGKSGRYIPASEAMAHVAGYACYNDASIRDWQRHTHQFTPGKNFPGTGAFGPWMVTSDEIPDVTSLTLTTRLNGQVVQQARLDQLIFPIPELIAYCSSFTPLAPGDVIATGTPGGVGARREPPLWMKAGDRVEVDISGVGRLENSVADE